MADNIANILMRLGGEDDGASDTLESFLGKLKAFGTQEATATADVSTGGGAAKLLALGAQLQKFGAQKVTAEANIDVDRSALKNLSKAFDEIGDIDLPTTKAPKIEIPVEVQREGMDRALAGLQNLIQEHQLEIEPHVDGDQARAELSTLAAELAALAQTVSAGLPDIGVDVDVNQAAALAGLAVFSAAVETVNNQDVEVDVDTSALIRVPILLSAIETGLKNLGDQKITLDVDAAPAVAQFAVFNAAVNAIADTQVEVEPIVDTTNLQALQALLRQFDQEQRDVTVGVDTAEGESRLAAFLVAAQGVAQDINVDVEVDTASANASLAELMAAVKVADSQRINIDADVGKVSLATMLMTKLASVMASGVGGAQKMAGAIGGITVNLGPFGVKLTAVTGIVLSLAGAMGVSLVAALGLLVTALAGATAAVGALATAFVGALGPIVAVAIATISRITKVVQALKAKNDAEKAGAPGSAQAAALEERRHDALIAVGRALRSVGSAERGLAQARDAARDAIVQANRDEQAAGEALAQSSQEVARTMEEAFKAMAQSAEDVRDALLDIEGGEIGVERSKIASERAKNALAELRGEAGLAGKELSKAFNKFTDVDFDFDVEDLDSILKGPGGGKTSQDLALDLKDAILDVREAKLNEKKANDALENSEQSLIEKRKAAADFAKNGIAAYAPYTAAVNAHEDATVRLADATARANELEQQGVDNAPAVLAAQDALTNANEALVESRRNARNLAGEAAGGAAAKKAKEDWDALTESEKAFAEALRVTGVVLRSTFGGAVRGVFNGLTASLKKLPMILIPLGPSFTKLGEAIGATIEGFTNLLSTPEMSKAFGTLIDGAAKLVTILGGKAWQSFFTIMTNLAVSAMPLLTASATLFANALERIAKKTKDPKKMGSAMASLGEILFGVLGLVKQLGRIFINFFRTTSGQSKGFIGSLTAMAKTFADFIGSEEGQKKIQGFFKAIIPLALETIKFIGNAILFILQIVETVAPALTGILKALNLFLGILNRILSVLKPFLKIAAQIALLFLGGLPLAIAKFLSKFRLLAPIAQFLTRHIVGVVTTIIGRIAAIASFFPTVFDKVKTFILGFISWVGKRFGEVVDIITWPFEQAIKFITDLAGRFYEAGKGIVSAIIEGMKSLINGIGGIAGKVFKFLVDQLPGSEPRDKSSPLAGLADRGKAIMENIAAGIEPGSLELSAALHRALVPVVAGIDASIGVPQVKTPLPFTAGAKPEKVIPTENHFHIEAPGGALPDAEATARAIARRMERSSGGSPRA